MAGIPSLQPLLLKQMQAHGGWQTLSEITAHSISEKGAVYKAVQALVHKGLVEKRESNIHPLYRALP